jgi:homoserine dehydrogenase
MNKNSVLRLGLFGFGCVGQGLHNVLSKTNGINAHIERICIKHPDKKRILPSDCFTTNAREILDNPDIDVVVELIDDPIAAYDIVRTALMKGKAVVSANKKLIAEHLEEFLELQKTYNTPFLYEGSVCGSIPVIRNLEEYYDNDLLSSISGIFNGSTNYILSKMRNEGWNFDKALRVAQEKGFAESNPFLDVSGLDAKYKLCIALMHAFGVWIRPDDMLNIGIERLNEQDFVYAQQHHKVIKLVVHGQRQDDAVIGFVMPTFVGLDNPLSTVNDEFNGVLMESAFANQQFFGGKGAGSDPTGSAVLSDISALTYGYRYEYKKLHQPIQYREGRRQLLEVYVRYKDKSVVNWDDFESIHQRFESHDYNYVIGSIFLEKLHGEIWHNNPNISVVMNALASAQSVGITPPQSAAAAPEV